MVRNRFIIVILAALPALALLCCCMEEHNPELLTYDSFYATVEGEVGDNVTKAHFAKSSATSGNHAVKWDNDDRIMVYSDMHDKPQEYARNGSEAFAGNSLSGNTFYAFYPSSGVRTSNTSDDVQFTSPGPVINSDKVSMPMVAYGSGNSLSFKQTCSVLHFFLTSSVSFDRIKLKGNGGEDIAGIGRVNMTSSSPTFSIFENASKEIVADVPSGVDWKNGVDVYFVIPPVHFYSGFTLTVENSNTTLSKRTTKSVSCVRQKMKCYTLDLDAMKPQYVDLGLSVKWATFNVGATKPEEYGDYFAWGETGPKGINKWAAYSSSNSSAKYNTGSKAALNLEDDAAHVNWGGSWRTPTYDQWCDLIDNCIWAWTDNYNETGVAGRIVSSNKPGYTDKSIFLPAAGYWYDKNCRDVGSCGCYWSSSSYESHSGCAKYVYFNNKQDGGVLWSYESYGYGQSIRPVTE